MRLSTALVAVKKITSTTLGTNFDEEPLKKLAEQILKAEGLISPLILRRNDLQSYEVIDGHFEYYAAVKAREIDPRKGEMISAYIIESENPVISSAILEQVELLKKSRSIALPSPEKSSKTIISQQIPEINQTPKNIKSLVDKIDAIENSLSNQSEQIKNIEKLVSSSSNLISDISNHNYIKKLEDYLIEIKQLINSSTKSQADITLQPQLKASIKSQDLILNDFNTLSIDELNAKILNAGFTKSMAMAFAEGIYNGRQSQPYTLTSGVIAKVKKLGTVSMQRMIASW